MIDNSIFMKGGDGIEIIAKPRTKFSSNALQRVSKHVDLASKIQTMSLNKVNVISRLNLASSQGLIIDKKVHTVERLPKILTFDSYGLNNMPSKKE